MSRMENLDVKLNESRLLENLARSAQGGMSEDDMFMRAGKLAQMFCVTVVFALPSLALWAYVL